MNRAKTIKKAAFRDSSGAKKSKTRRLWSLRFINFLLILLLVYLGRQTLQHVRNAIVEPEAPAATTTAATRTIPEAGGSVRPLNDVRIIWQRNLFNVSKDTPSAPQKEMSPDKLALAQKDIGLILVGTAVADNPELNRAFIDTRSARQQAAYREGDRAGRILIKKIMRNKVIIGTDNGDRLLTVENAETRQIATTRPAAQGAVAMASAPSQTSTSLSLGARDVFLA